MKPFRRAGRKGLHVKIKGADGSDKIVCVGEIGIREAERQGRALQERADLERQGLAGLGEENDAPPVDWFKTATLGDLCAWWLAAVSPTHASHAENVSAIGVLVLGNPEAPGGARPPTLLCHVKLRDLTAPMLVRFFAAMAKDSGYAPRSVNGFRDRLRAIINTAKGHGRWVGENPAEFVKALPVPEGLPEFLRAHEVPMVLASAEGEWQDIFAVAIYTAMRFGEILALQKIDCDLDSGYITVRRSHVRDTTKGKRAGLVPIAPGLRPYLESAYARNPASPLVFPAAAGGLKHKKTDGTRPLRTAMARAGLTLGYTLVCRRKGCGHTEDAPDASGRRCSACAMKLWPVAKVRPLHFHQLRHTTATLLLMEGVPLHAVSKILRHASVDITLKTYGHLTPGYLKAEMGALDAAIAPQNVRGELGDRLGSEGHSGAALGILRQASGDKSGDISGFPANSVSGLRTQSESFRGVRKVEPARIELATSALRNRPVGLSTPGHASQTVGNSGIDPKAKRRRRAPEGDLGQGSGDISGDRLSPEKANPPGWEILHGQGAAAGHIGPDARVSRYLTVKQAASLLQVSTATIYELCERGELPHRRVLNAIRIPAHAVEAAGRSDGDRRVIAKGEDPHQAITIPSPAKGPKGGRR